MAGPTQRMTTLSTFSAVASVNESSIFASDRISWLPGDPADSQLACGANDVVTSINFHDWNAALRAVHGFVVINHLLNCFFRACVFTLLSSAGIDLVLVLLAILIFVDCLASNTIDRRTDDTFKSTKIFVMFQEIVAVRGQAVGCLLGIGAFEQFQRLFEVLVKNFWRNQVTDLAFCEEFFAVTIDRVCVRTLDLKVFGVLHGCNETILAKLVLALLEDNSFADLGVREANLTLKHLEVLDVRSVVDLNQVRKRSVSDLLQAFFFTKNCL